MAQGKLAMVVCPILEDEMVYSIMKDPDEKRIYLVENDNTKTLLPKLAKNGIGYDVLNEDDFVGGKADIPDDGYSIIMWMMNLGLHSEPEKLKKSIRESLLQIDGTVDGIALYYGLCGNGLLGIREWAAQNMRTPITIFVDPDGKICDDCICVPLGSSANYLKLLKRYPGVLYETPAMACSNEEFMATQELFQGLEQTDMNREEFMKFMLDMAGYEYTLKIDTGLGDQEHFDEEFRKLAAKYGLKTKELEKEWISNDMADKIYAEAKSFLND